MPISERSACRGDSHIAAWSWRIRIGSLSNLSLGVGDGEAVCPHPSPLESRSNRAAPHAGNEYLGPIRCINTNQLRDRRSVFFLLLGLLLGGFALFAFILYRDLARVRIHVHLADIAILLAKFE